MNEPKLETYGPGQAAGGKRPWEAPRVIASELASRARIAKTSSSPHDNHSPGTVENGPSS